MRPIRQEPLIMRFTSPTARAILLGTALVLATPLAPLLPVSTAEARPAPDSFADLAAKLLPAVVNVSSTQKVEARAGGPSGPEIPMFPPGSPFEQFFKDFLNRNRPHGQGQGQGQGDQPAPERRMQSLGSGFIIVP